MTADAANAATDELLMALGLVASFHGRRVTPEALVAGLPLEEGRLTPSLVERAAEHAELSVRHARAPLDRLESTWLPALLLLEPGRACVLLRLDPANDCATVLWPEWGDAESEVALSELEARYSGHAIYIRPRFQLDARGTEVEPRHRHHWFWDVIRENRRLYRDVIAGSVAINLFAVAMPLFVLNVYDRVVPHHATETLWVLTSGILMVLVFDLALRLLRSRFVDRAATRADVKLSSRLMGHVLGMRMEARPATTGSFSAVLQSFESVRSFIGSGTVVALVDLPFVLMFVAIIALIGPPMAIPVIVGIVFVLLYAMASQRKLHELSETTWRVGAQRNATLVESVSQLETLKATRGESRVQGIWERASTYLARISAELRVLSASVSSVALWAQHTVAVSVVVVGVYLIMDGALTQGGLIAAYLLSSRAMAPISQAAGLLAQYHQSSTALESLDSVMESPLERPRGKSFVDRPVVEGRIRFEGVGFSYPEAGREALRDVDLSFDAGEKVALLGRVGCGKSTLARLLLGLYVPTAGAVRVDDVDIRQIDPVRLRSHIGYVPQEPGLFYGTLRENIVPANGAAVSDAALLRAIELAGLGDLVNAHPEGVELHVGEGGHRLSGGQRQAVAIARALVHEPRILMLDEPTSALDQSAEEALIRRLKDATADCTVLVATHRQSLLALVDRVVVLDVGRVVADGPRDEVLTALREGRIRRGS